MENLILLYDDLIDGTTFGDLHLLKKGLHLITIRVLTSIKCFNSNFSDKKNKS